MNESDGIRRAELEAACAAGAAAAAAGQPVTACPYPDPTSAEATLWRRHWRAALPAAAA